MEFSRLKKMTAAVSVAAISLAQVGSVFAAYGDVAAGVWYGDAVGAFTDAGYLDGSQSNFRGGDSANRAEFVKLVVELNGGTITVASKMNEGTTFKIVLPRKDPATVWQQ